MNEIKKIIIEFVDEDYCPIRIEDDDGAFSVQGGGNVFCAVIGLLGAATGAKIVKDKWDRMDTLDRDHIARRIETAFGEVCLDVEFYINNNYKKNDK